MMLQKAKPLHGHPTQGAFCAGDRFLSLQRLTVTESIPPTTEDNSLFVYVEQGNGTISVNGLVFDLHPGSFCWLQSYHVFSIDVQWGKPLELCVVVYDYPLANYMTFHNGDRQNLRRFAMALPVYQLEAADRAQVETLLREFADCSGETDPGSNLIKCGILGQLSYLYFTLCNRYQEEHTRFSHQWPLAWSIVLFVAFLCSEDLDAKEVADTFGVSVATLNRELRVSTGFNFAQTLNRARVNLASSAILFSELSFHFISTYCGFRSEVAFYRTFKEYRGMTPQEYREHSVNTAGVPRKMVSETVERILYYMHSNYREQISLRSMAQDLYISENIIRTLLRDTLNTNFKTILTDCRIRYAEALLVVTDLPILDISLASGFNSDRTFSRLFHQRNGIPPSAYRAKYGGMFA